MQLKQTMKQEDFWSMILNFDIMTKKKELPILAAPFIDFKTSSMLK